MRGFITRRFSLTTAKIGYYDMSTNKMVECKTIKGKWKNADQVQKYCKKNREFIGIPEGKQITVLGMDTETELRKMSHEKFYLLSEPVREPENKEKTKNKAKTKNTKEGRKR